MTSAAVSTTAPTIMEQPTSLLLLTPAVRVSVIRSASTPPPTTVVNENSVAARPTTTPPAMTPPQIHVIENLAAATLPATTASVNPSSSTTVGLQLAEIEKPRPPAQVQTLVQTKPKPPEEKPSCCTIM
jgi:hypothetical protein